MMSRSTVAQMLARAILVAFVVVFVGCTDSAAPGRGGAFYGAPVTVGHGLVRSFVVVNEERTPADLGLAMND